MRQKDQYTIRMFDRKNTLLKTEKTTGYASLRPARKQMHHLSSKWVKFRVYNDTKRYTLGTKTIRVKTHKPPKQSKKSLFQDRFNKQSQLVSAGSQEKRYKQIMNELEKEHGPGKTYNFKEPMTGKMITQNRHEVALWHALNDY